jgi:hypothetical protein
MFFVCNYCGRKKLGACKGGKDTWWKRHLVDPPNVLPPSVQVTWWKSRDTWWKSRDSWWNKKTLGGDSWWGKQLFSKKNQIFFKILFFCNALVIRTLRSITKWGGHFFIQNFKTLFFLYSFLKQRALKTFQLFNRSFLLNKNPKLHR